MQSLTFEERLTVLGQRARRVAARYFQYARRGTNNMISDAEWHQHGLAAAYLAFVECGGDPDAPDTFNWDNPQLLPITLKHLRAAILGQGSDFIDIHQRNQARKTGACNDSLAWDAWRAGVEQSPKGKHTDSPAPITGEYYAHDAFDQAPREYTAESLMWALAKVLKPQEVFWLIRRYRDNVPQDALAKELCERDQRYQDDTGHARAINYINVTIHRAKKRAQRALGSKWQALALEVA